jgi:hypothetical protein
MPGAASDSYCAREFVERCRKLRITPHIAEYEPGKPQRLDQRTKAHPGYRISGKARMLIEKIFGWTKSVGGMRRSRFRGLRKTGFFATICTAAYNLTRMTRLLEPTPA